MVNNSELTISELMGLILKKKWVFIIIFIVVFAACLAYFFITPDEYSYGSKIKISEDFIENNNSLYDYYPVDMERLYLFPTHRRDKLEEVYLDVIVNELYSDEMINELYESLDGEISIQLLWDSVNIYRDSNNDNVYVGTAYSDPAISEEINRKLIDNYISEKQVEFENSYEVLLARIKKDVEDLDSNIEDLNIEKNKAEAEYSLENSKPREERNVEYLAERLADTESYTRRINNLDKKYTLLDDTQNNLLNNEEFFINRIIIIQEPRLVESREFSLRNSIIYGIVISFIAAFIITFITAIASYARYMRKY